MREDFIMNRLKEHYEFAKKTGHEIVFLALQGSQNYGLDVYSDNYVSDIDTKAVILPSFEDICKNREPVSKTLVLPNNEHCDLKDIRVMFKCFEKQNVNFIEILFTKYIIINPDYEDFVKELLSMNEEIAHINFNQALKCMAGMSKEKLKAMEHPYPNTEEKIKKYGYDPKQLHHILRMKDFIIKYINGRPYSECLIPENPEYLKEIKTKPIPLEEARELAKKTDKDTEMLKALNLRLDSSVNKETLEKMSDLTYKMLKRYYKETLFLEDN